MNKHFLDTLAALKAQAQAANQTVLCYLLDMAAMEAEKKPLKKAA